MFRRELSSDRPPTLNDEYRRQGLMNGLLVATLAVVVLLVSTQLIGRLGVPMFTMLLILAFFGSIYAYVSLRSLIIPFSIVILSVGGFRFLWAVQMPGLPDLYVDRMAMIWLVVVYGVKAVAERRPLRPPYLLDWLMIANLVYLVTSSFFVDFKHFSLLTRSYFVPYAMYFMAKNIVSRQRAMRLLLALLAILNLYYSITSIAEKFALVPLIWPKSILFQENMWWGRSNGPFNHAPLFGTVQGMILPVYLYFIATARNRLLRMLSYVGLMLGLAGLYFTYTRGSWLVGIAALGVAVLLNRRRYLRISIPAFGLLPLIAVFVLGMGNDEMMKDRVDDDQTITARMGTWVTAMRIWRDHPLVGVGFFQYRHVRHLYIDPVEVPIFGTIRFANFRHTSLHDIYMGPLAETGIMGTSLQLFIYLMIFRAFFRHYRNRRGPPHFRLYLLPVFGGMCVGYLAGGISIDYRFFSMVNTMFYAAAGIVYGYSGDTVVHVPGSDDDDARFPDAET